MITKVCIFIHVSCKYQASSIAGRKNIFYLFAMCMAYHISNERGVRFIEAFRQLKRKTNTHESLQAKQLINLRAQIDIYLQTYL